MKQLLHTKGFRSVLAITCALALSGGMTGCVSKARYNKALAANEACQQRSAEEEARLSQLHSMLNDTRSGLAMNGASTGDASDEQIIAEIRQALNDKDTQIGNYKNQLTAYNEQATFKLLAKYLFPSGSAKLTGDGRVALNKVATWLKESNSRHIFVEGYTDDRPIGPTLKHQYASNWELSTHRATTVARFLIDNGVPEERVITAGYGENEPVEANNSDTAREQNRRIEIKLHDAEFRDVVGKIPDSVPQTALIDVNRATARQLEVLPGVTPDLARSVVDYRARAGRFTSFDDLKQVRGFDADKLNNISTMVTFSGTSDQSNRATGTDTRSQDQNYYAPAGTSTETAKPAEKPKAEPANKKATTGTDKDTKRTEDKNIYVVPKDSTVSPRDSETAPMNDVNPELRRNDTLDPQPAPPNPN